MVNYIEFKNITKRFFNNIVLKDVNFTIGQGETHALLGENGAGKSTLLNILHGVYSDYEGNVHIAGNKVHFKNANEAIVFGISKVHQEVSLAYEMTVGQNIALGYEPSVFGFVKYKELYKKTDEILKRLGCKFSSTDIAGNLSTGEMQMILIAKALFHNAKIISFDEPTAALSDNETKNLFRVINDLKTKGITILYVTHRLNEVFEISDKVTILRDGRFISSCKTEELTKEQLIKAMVGRDVSAFAVRKNPSCVKEEVVLEVKNLSVEHVFKDISFSLKKGQILSFSGLVGSKRTDVMRAIFGADKISTGSILLNGKPQKINSPQDAVKHKIGLIPENRKTQGIVKYLSNTDNMSLASLKKFSPFGFLNAKEKLKNCMYYIDKMLLSPSNPNYETMSLSGGNQQKVVISKWLTTEADIYIFDEPTKGIDVGAKTEIYTLMEELVAEGKSIIMVSSELPEVIGMSDNVIVMREGRIAAYLDKDQLNEETILSYAMEG